MITIFAFIIISYILLAYLTMYIAVSFKINKIHKPNTLNKLIGILIFLLAPITFILLMGWFLFCIVYNWITD